MIDKIHPSRISPNHSSVLFGANFLIESHASIAFQGAPGAFSYRAGQLFAEQSGIAVAQCQFVACRSFEEVFQTVIAPEKPSTAGVVPLENSSVGSIVANYDLLWRNNVQIICEICLPVHHQLIGFEGTDVSSITAVYSHPVALDQCKKFLKNYPGMQPNAYWDTSGAAFHVKEAGNKAYAAIASQFAALETGLAILQRDIEDHCGNTTRFGVIVKEGEKQFVSEVTLPYKISFAGEVQHKPGTLATLLKAFATAGVNLTKIESRPIPEQNWHYRFFMDIEVTDHKQDKAVLAALKKHTETFKVLGRYVADKNGDREAAQSRKECLTSAS